MRMLEEILESIKVENNLSLMRLISSIAIIDQEKQKFWLIDLSPDINEQLRLLRKYINKYDIVL